MCFFGSTVCSQEMQRALVPLKRRRFQMWIVPSSFMTFYLAMFLFLLSTISYIYIYIYIERWSHKKGGDSKCELCCQVSWLFIWPCFYSYYQQFHVYIFLLSLLSSTNILNWKCIHNYFFWTEMLWIWNHRNTRREGLTECREEIQTSRRFR